MQFYGGDDDFSGPGPLDSNRTAYYYVQTCAGWSVDYDSPLNVAYNQHFRKKLVENLMRGRYLPGQIALSNPSLYRRLYVDQMYYLGWSYYIYELLLREGYFENQDEMLAEFYGELKSLAVQTEVDVGLNCGKYNMVSASMILMDKLQADIDYAIFRSLFSSVYPFSGVSCIAGMKLFKDMRNKAETLEDEKFDLKAFHHKILSEGAIPPVLIARKYGWD